ncbi:MAG: hypothetical protein PHU46_03030 [Rhodocyclaceae bacterium]|nr:hypothetical protein [Rhodocyclaceae bacterium]
MAQIVGRGTPVPWRTDAWSIREARKNNNAWIVVSPSGLKEFLNPENHDCPTRLICGPKGCGKSALVLAKRVLLEREVDSHKALCIPEAFPKVFTAIGPTDSIKFRSWDKVSEYSSITTWVYLWKLIFGSYAIAALEKERRNALQVGLRESSEIASASEDTLLPKKLGVLLFGGDYCAERDIGTRAANDELVIILEHLVERHGVSPDTIYDAYSEHVLPVFRRIAKDGEHNPIYIFVDGVDELLKTPVEDRDFLTIAKSGVGPYQASASDDMSRDDAAVRHLAMDLWACAQVSLIGASLEMASETRGCVKLVGTLRSEARDRKPLPKAQGQLGHLVKEVRYTKETLATIFEENIRVCERQKMVEPAAAEMLQRFLGAATYIHSATNKQENAFAGILRHTFEQPRELMLIGQALYELSPQERKTPLAVRTVINEISNDPILVDYLKYMGEAWDEDLAAATFPKIGVNILTRQDVESINQEVESDTVGRIRQPFCYLYSLGLIGIPVADATVGKMHQEFLLPTRYPNREYNAHQTQHSLPIADYYFIHPALAERIRKERHRTGYMFTTHGAEIVGDGKPWDEHTELKRISLRRYCPTDGAVDGLAISLSIDGHQLGYCDDQKKKRGTFSSIDDASTFILVCALLALQKKRLAPGGDKSARVISMEDFNCAAQFVSSQDEIRRSLGRRLEGFVNKLAGQVSKYLIGTNRDGHDSKKYPPALVEIRERLRAHDINSISIGINGKNVFLDGAPYDEIRIAGFGIWDS